MRDAVVAGPRSAPRGGRSKTSDKAKPRRARAPFAAFGMLRRHKGKAFAAACCATMTLSIVGNAIFFQSGRHPAPLFGSASASRSGAEQVASIPLPPPAPRPVVAAPQPPATDLSPVEQAASPDVAALDPKPAAAGPTPIRPLRSKVASVHKDDPIGRLLRGGEPAAPSPSETDPHMAAAQRSLEKLGFSVKPDGRMGHSTRQALEKFQHDHHLPGGEELSPKLLRELATAAGHPPG